MSAGRGVNRFVILFPGRTGSTFLVEALDAHPRVDARFEIMRSGLDNDDSPAEQIERARRELTATRKPGCAAVGFKTKLRDVLDPDGFGALLEELDVRLILMTRRNLIKLNVSSYNSERLREQTGDWNAYAPGTLADEPLWIDPDDFALRLESYERWLDDLVEFVRRLARPTLWLTYESLLADPDETVALAFRFVGVEPLAARGRTVKSTADDLSLAVRNFGELRARFAGTRYEAMFDERQPLGDEAAA